MPISVKTYRENRARFPVEELKKYQGEWVAFGADGNRIVASAPSIAELETAIIAAGENPENVGLERVDLEDVWLGGAEML